MPGLQWLGASVLPILNALLIIILASDCVAMGTEVRGQRSEVSLRYLTALSDLESGGNDFKRGRAGELGRYQCLKSVWKIEGGNLKPEMATNPITAAAVTVKVIRGRTGKEIYDLTPEQFARAWHCPSAKRLNREQRDYVERFCNLTRKTVTNQKITLYTK